MGRELEPQLVPKGEKYCDPEDVEACTLSDVGELWPPSAELQLPLGAATDGSPSTGPQAVSTAAETDGSSPQAACDGNSHRSKSTARSSQTGSGVTPRRLGMSRLLGLRWQKFLCCC